MSAAEEVFSEKGFFAARIQDIAERGGFAVGTVYKHFEQKEDVLRALMLERSVEMHDQLEPRDDDPAGWQDKLVTRIARLFTYVEQHRAFYRIAMENGLFGVVSASVGSALSDKDRKVLLQVKERMRELIDEGIAEGVLADVEPGLLSGLLFGTVRSFSLGAFELGESPEAKAAMIVDLFLNGAKRRTKAERASAEKLKAFGKKAVERRIRK
ncbi:MAG TPA: TetR/AcrR family transcriptional regulator [Polyangiaceae bacterium]